MAGRYPEIEPYASGMLAVGEGNLVYWETCGNPDGTPAVVLHGAPGSGCSTSMRRYFDPTSLCPAASMTPRPRHAGTPGHTTAPNYSLRHMRQGLLAGFPRSWRWPPAIA